jgi:hypothetical protein
MPLCILRSLQVMSEEKASGFQTDAVADGVKRITNIGVNPWTRALSGTVKFKRTDAAKLKALPLDFNGYPDGKACAADSIQLQPATIYYLISRDQ